MPSIKLYYMDPINRLNRLVESLRQQMAESSRRLDMPGRAPAGETPRGTMSLRLALPELRRQIQERIRAAGPPGQAKRVFLESVLAWEFGDNLLSDPRYQTLLDNLQAAIENDNELDKQFAALLVDLTGR